MKYQVGDIVNFNDTEVSFEIISLNKNGSYCIKYVGKVEDDIIREASVEFIDGKEHNLVESGRIREWNDQLKELLE